SLARSSNFGRTSVDLAAPGENIESTIPVNLAANPYGFDSGTSMAAPLVSGVAALVYSQHPDATPQEIRDAILHGVDKLDTLNAKVASGGRLNALGALTAETFAPRATIDAVADITAVSSADRIV